MVARIARALVLGMFILIYLAVVCAAQSLPDLSASRIDRLTGEQHHYAIDFLFFKRLAVGELTLRETQQRGVYEAELVGRTLGVAAWLTGDRIQRYVSRMQLMDDGTLRSLVHESQIIKRKRGELRNSGKRYTFDYLKREVVQERARDGSYAPGRTFELPDQGQPVDILTAFYNLRLGAYGAVVSGRQIRIPTFTKNGSSEIIVKVLNFEPGEERAFFPSHGTLLQIWVDPEVFETSSGQLSVWFDAEGIPSRGIIEDLIGLGDVRGYREESVP